MTRISRTNGTEGTDGTNRTNGTEGTDGTNRTDRTDRTDTPRGTIRPALRGAFTALVTPFTPDGALDDTSLRQLVRWQVLAGIDGLVPCGTTGESPTLTQEERDRVIALTVETVAERPSRSRVTIVAGTGTNDTAATIAATRRAVRARSSADRVDHSAAASSLATSRRSAHR